MDRTMRMDSETFLLPTQNMDGEFPAFRQLGMSPSVVPESEQTWVFHNKSSEDGIRSYLAFIFDSLGHKRIQAAVDIRLDSPGHVLVRLMRHGTTPLEEATRTLHVGTEYVTVKLPRVFRNDHAQYRIQIHSLDGMLKRVGVRNLVVRPESSEGALLCLEDLAEYSYSCKRHFDTMSPMACYAGHNREQADLKMYQDMLVHSAIRSLLAPGARILEVGSGNSRLAESLCKDYDYWCLDKFEGIGNGPVEVDLPKDVRVVRDYLGAFSRELPDGTFGLVCSVSVFEHLPHEEKVFSHILADIDRLSAPDGWSLHCVDSRLLRDMDLTHPVVAYIQGCCRMLTRRISPYDIAMDPDLFFMTEEAYDARWKKHTGMDYEFFGKPYSINLAWQNLDERSTAKTKTDVLT